MSLHTEQNQRSYFETIACPLRIFRSKTFQKIFTSA